MNRAFLVMGSCVALMTGCSSTTTVASDAAVPQDSASDSVAPDASSGGCPTVTLPTTLPLSYAGDTTGKANLVTSARLEWTDAPDDALLFVAPQAGTYRIGMPTAPSTNGGCGASAREYGTTGSDGLPYTESSCPASGTTKAIDGIFAALPPSSTEDFQLTQGQHLLIWVSCTSWSTAKSGPYTLTIQKL